MAVRARQGPAGTAPPTMPTDLSGLSSIGPPSTTFPTDAPIVSATALSTVTTLNTRIFAASNGAAASTSVFESTILITDSAQLAPTTSTIASSSHVSSTATSAAASSATSAASAKSTSKNSSTLIPAIVAPVAVVMLVSLALFWYFMRRRHRRELARQPEFVMAGKGEKLASSPDSSIRSGPRGLGKSIEAGVAETQSAPQLHLRPDSSHELKEFNGLKILSPPQYTMEEIGVARPLTPADQRPSTSHSSTRPHSPHFSPIGTDPRGPPRPRPNPNHPRNFNRPGPPPGMGTPQMRDRSRSSPGNRPAGPPPNHSPEENHLPANPYPYNRPPTAPTPRMPWSGPSPRAPPTRSFSPNAPPTFSPTANIAFSPQSNSSIRSPPPAPIKAPPPTGAYNGGSAISQYSPIVKDHPPDARRHHPSPVDELEGEKPRFSHDSSHNHPYVQDEEREDHDAISDISPDDHDMDTKSDVSSLDERGLGRFDFERDLNSGRGSANRSGGGTPVGVGLGLGLGTGGRESPWSLAN